MCPFFFLNVFSFINLVVGTIFPANELLYTYYMQFKKFSSIYFFKTNFTLHTFDIHYYIINGIFNLKKILFVCETRGNSWRMTGEI